MAASGWVVPKTISHATIQEAQVSSPNNLINKKKQESPAIAD